MEKNNFKANIIFLITAMIWGLAFVAQDKVAEYVTPFTVNAIRSYLGSAVLLPVIWAFSKKREDKTEKAESRKTLIKAGIICGICLCVAVNFQQFGIMLYPDGVAASGRTGFLTALYVVLVPVIELFSGKKPRLNMWISVLFATFGMYLLCLGGGINGVYFGDIIVIFCAVAFALQIHFIDKYIGKVDAIKLSSVQFFVCGVISSLLMLIFEKPDINDIYMALGMIIYLGVVSSGLAYTLQIVAQKYSDNTTVGAVIMSLESVFAALGGALIASERMTAREIIGCIIMFAAVIISQMPKNS